MAILGLIYGINPYLKEQDYNRRLSLLGLKTATGLGPRVLSIYDIDEYRKKILVGSQGIGIDQYRAKKSDLESAFKTTVESINACKNNFSLVEIYTTAKDIPKLVQYSDCLDTLKAPMQFVLGESRGGILSQSLLSLPHMMIAGTTGGGKSNFFKQTVLSILKTTKNVQMYILDLKLGVEAKDFSSLPNVRVAKDESEANYILSQVRDEMKKRFEILEKNGTKQIDPEKDKKDIIVVAVDESSVLYGKTKISSAKSKMSIEARELTDDLAKLGRAARVHLILATQKVTTDTIDTKIQENIGGRICFRANTLQGSMQVLGNKMAYELPDIKGRAIWSNGTTFVEVQTPLVDDDTLENEINTLKKNLSERKNIMFGKLFSSKLTVMEDEV